MSHDTAGASKSTGADKQTAGVANTEAESVSTSADKAAETESVSTAADKAAETAGCPEDSAMDTDGAKQAGDDDTLLIDDIPSFDDAADEEIEKEIKAKRHNISQLKAELQRRRGGAQQSGEESGVSSDDSDVDDDSIKRSCEKLEAAINKKHPFEKE